MVTNPDTRIARRSRRSLISALLEARSRHGGKKEILIDADDRRLTLTEIVRAAYALGHAATKGTKRGEKVGILLPTGAGSLIAFFALQAYGRVPAMLNFTAGAHNLRAACRAAEVTKILTAHKFIELANLENLAKQLSEFAELVYLEDVREALTTRDKLAAIVGPLMPWLISPPPRHDAPGVILFTSGTEGAPKGVVLSHANVLANIEQINLHVQLEPTDILFNPLPTFHCYGLTAGSLWPILAGQPLVMHPSPLQTKIIPKRIKETGATILLAPPRAAGSASMCWKGMA
jgi:acyl-[acyl-carrier-protein]-phospholipid O-acyltransferase/long-chain-fatty-acid--[acyl-carrier-protein] ligase